MTTLPDRPLENRLPRVPAHMVSLAGEQVVRMRVDAAGAASQAGERAPFATVDLAALRTMRSVGVTPG